MELLRKKWIIQNVYKLFFNNMLENCLMKHGRGQGTKHDTSTETST
jgi:hypothetical protein